MKTLNAALPDDLAAALHLHGLTGETSPDDLLRVTCGRSSATYDVLRLRRLSPDDADRLGAGPASLVFTPHLSLTTATRLHESGRQFIDESGNAHLRFGDVLIDVRGLPRRPRQKTGERTSSTHLFSTRRAQVIAALLTWPTLLDGTLEDLAAASGASLGTVHSTKRLLTVAGWLTPDGRHLAQADKLLTRWAEVYPTTLGTALHRDEFRGDATTAPRLPDQFSAAISGEHAAHALVEPLALTLYVDDLPPELMRLNRWHRAADPNVEIRRRFWRTPGSEDVVREGGLETAPWPLVYADLLSAGSPRLVQVAEEWRAMHADA